MARFPVPQATSRTFVPGFKFRRFINSSASLVYDLAICPKSPAIQVALSLVFKAVISELAPLSICQVLSANQSALNIYSIYVVPVDNPHTPPLCGTGDAVTRNEVPFA